jgi:hypothetical protein
MHLSMQIPTHPLPGISGDLNVSWSLSPAPGVVLLYTPSIINYMLHILIVGYLPKYLPPGERLLHPLCAPYPGRGGVGICIDKCIKLATLCNGIIIILWVHDYGIMSLSSSSTAAAVLATTTAVPAVAHRRRGGVAASLGSTHSAKKPGGWGGGGAGNDGWGGIEWHCNI